MYAQVEKPKENKAVTNSVAQKKSSVRQGLGFPYNRPQPEIYQKFQNNRVESAQQLSVSTKTGDVIQRMIVAGDASNEKLKHIYDELVFRSLMLRILGYAVGKDKKILIRFGNNQELEGRKACYLADEKKILINENFSESSEADIKPLILIELNHARESMNGQKGNENINMPEILEDHGNSEWKALEALRVEYLEWGSAYLVHIQITNINEYTIESKRKTEMEQESDEITPFVPGYLYDPDAEYTWLSFVDYLEMQRPNHTSLYDPKAKDEDWVGLKLLTKAMEISNEGTFVMANVVKMMDLSGVEGYEDSQIIDPTTYHELLRRKNPFNGELAQDLMDNYT